MVLQRSPSSDLKDLYDTKPGIALASVSILSARAWNSAACSCRRRERNTVITMTSLAARRALDPSTALAAYHATRRTVARRFLERGGRNVDLPAGARSGSGRR